MKNVKIVTSVFVLLCFMGNVWALDDVPYLDESGVEQAVDGVTVIEADGGARTLSEGWYLVRGAFSNNGTITIDGTVQLILEDGSDLAVRGSSTNAGINVSEGNSLTIYAQSVDEDMGKLTATGNGNTGSGAGIGGGSDSNGGTITITGGTVTAKGGSSSDFANAGAGIGGGSGGSGGTITISGGNVTAGSNSSFPFAGAGIGGGNNGSGGTITISGGTVTATGDIGGAGIGGGVKGDGGAITISGGTVTAKGSGNNTYNGGGAGIGGGDDGSGGEIAIIGGMVTATSYCVGIGSGYNRSGSQSNGGSNGTVTISGGTVKAIGGYGGAGIGGSSSGNGVTVTITDGTVTATGGYGNAGIGGGGSSSGGTITISGGIVTATGGNVGAGIGNGISGRGGTITITGGAVTATGGEGGAGIGNGGSGSGSEITISGGTVTAIGGDSGGVGIGGGSGSEITIIGGTVTATGGGYGAGIDGRIGTLTISDGTVTAIGGGYGGAGIYGINGTITISGGIVTATGGNSGSQSGGGSGIGGGTITISGGIVKTTGGNGNSSSDMPLFGGGAGIGSGIVGGFDSEITIIGGTVTAIGGYGRFRGAGIGGSIGGTSNTFTLGGNAVVFTSSISTTAELTLKHGILFVFNVIDIVTVFDGTIAAAFPAKGVTAMWMEHDGINGIAYSSDDNEGFIEIPNVTLIKREIVNKVPYIDVTGEMQTKDGITVIDAENIDIASNSNLNGWYLVRGVINNTATLKVSGEAHIILEDGSDLRVTVDVSEGNSLTIYAQSTDENIGRLTANYVGNTSNCGAITITGGIVTAQGIGGSNGIVTISGGTVTAYQGIGGSNGTVTISSGTVTASEGIGGSNGTVTISGGTVTAYQGIGGNNGTVTITGGTVTATGGVNGAGIDGGNGGTITISGGTVTATGGYGGAGIGGGSGRSGGTITISGGTVTANGGNGGAGIGGGANGTSGTFTLGGNAVVFASSVSDTEESRRTSGILFISKNCKVYGNIELQKDLNIEMSYNLTIPENATLTIPSGITLTIPRGAILINDGTITPANGSTITMNGTVNGKIEGANTFPSMTVIGKTSTSITLDGTTDLLANTGQEIEYAISQTDDVPVSGWQTETTFAGLAEKADYWIFARSKENTYFKAGAVSAVLQATTKPAPSIADLKFDIPTGHIYTGTAQGFDISIAGIGAITVYYNENPDKPTNAGKYAITVDVAESTDFDMANGIALGEYEIAAKPVTVTADAKTKVYGTDMFTNPDPVLTYSTEPALLGSDRFSGSLSRAAGNKAGSYAINQGTLTAGNNYSIIFNSANFEITHKPITITNVTATSRIYNGTPTITLTGGILVGVNSGDRVGFALGSGTVATAGSGNSKPVTTNIALTGDDANNYTLTQPTSVTANITAKAVTVTDITAASKEYDGTVTAAITGTATINGTIDGDIVTVTNGTASFANKNVGTDKTVTFSGFSLSGTDAGNYTLSAQPTRVMANITAKPVTITDITAASKEYDGNTTATVTGTATVSGAISGDNLIVTNGTASFADKNVGTGKTVTFNFFSLRGADANNYTLSAQPADVTADITAKPVTITGITARNKEYDGTATATVTGTATISGVIEGDSVTVIKGTASFADGNIGTNKTVTFSGFSLDGTDADNYTLSAQPASITAEIFGSTPILSQIATSNRLITPTQNGITLTANTTATIAVYNLSGKLINRQSYNAGSHSISLGHLPKGVYIVKASQGGGKDILRVAVR